MVFGVLGLKHNRIFVVSWWYGGVGSGRLLKHNGILGVWGLWGW